MVSNLALTISSYIPDEWRLTHIGHLDPDFIAVIHSGKDYVSATGETIEEALNNAASKTDDPRQYMGVYGTATRSDEPEAGRDLLSQLGLLKPKAKLERRL